MSEFDTGLPSIRQLQNFIKDKERVELKLIGVNQSLVGQILWQDENCICVMSAKKEKILVWYQGLVYIKSLG